MSRVSTASAASVAALLGAICLCLTGCGGKPPSPEPTSRATSSPSPPAKNGTGEERHDLAPLTKRFPALGLPTTARWYSGTLGDDRVPGPSSYWIDAVVTLEPSAAKSLATDYAAEPASTRPNVVKALRGAVPTGPLVTSEQLDRALSTAFSTQAWISLGTGQVVLVSKGQ